MRRKSLKSLTSKLSMPLSSMVLQIVGSFALGLVSILAVGADDLSPLARKLADGTPWVLTFADGKTGSAVFRPNGEASVTGLPVTANAASWRPTRTGLCLRIMVIAPEKCVDLSEAKGQIVAKEAGTLVFMASR